jgi:hypothetical protein
MPDTVKESPRPVLGPAQSPIQVVPGAPTSVKTKNAWRYTSSPSYALMLWLIRQSDLRVSRFDILTAVTMKSVLFYDVTPCSLAEVCERFKD